MRIKPLYLLNIILTIVLLTSLLVSAATNRSGTAAISEYDPWVDLNDDGIIDIFDLVTMATRYGTLGDPTKNVNVTNWPEWLTVGNVTVTNFPLDDCGNLRVSMKSGANYPIATNHLTAILRDTHSGDATPPSILSNSRQVAGIGGKNLTFVNGGLSGGATWSSHETGTEKWFETGETLGVGRVEVYDSSNTLLAQFALPFDTMISVQNVDKIIVYAEAPIPYICYWASYSASVIASVYWVEQ